MGTDRVTGQEAMLFMLIDRVDRIEQNLEGRLEREALLREELASWKTRLERQEKTIEVLQAEVHYFRHTTPWLRRWFDMPIDILIGFTVGSVGCLVMLGIEKLIRCN